MSATETKATRDYKVMYQDARGWHEMPGVPDEDGSSDSVGAWVTDFNNNDCPQDLIITRVVVTDATGAKVCEWSAIEEINHDPR